MYHISPHPPFERVQQQLLTAKYRNVSGGAFLGPFRSPRGTGRRYMYRLHRCSLYSWLHIASRAFRSRYDVSVFLSPCPLSAKHLRVTSAGSQRFYLTAHFRYSVSGSLEATLVPQPSTYIRTYVYLTGPRTCPALEYFYQLYGRNVLPHFDFLAKKFTETFNNVDRPRSTTSNLSYQSADRRVTLDSRAAFSNFHRDTNDTWEK